MRTLGEQPFAYHGELRPLNASEAEQFLARCLEAVYVEGKRVPVTPELASAIFEACEGFPSFMQELLRALYLKEGAFGRPAGQEEDPLSVWSVKSITEGLAQLRSAVKLSSTDSGVFPSITAQLGRIDIPDERPPPGPRHAILIWSLTWSCRCRVTLSGQLPSDSVSRVSSLLPGVTRFQGWSRGGVHGIVAGAGTRLGSTRCPCCERS